MIFLLLFNLCFAAETPAAAPAEKEVKVMISKMHCTSCADTVKATVCEKVKNTGCSTHIMTKKERKEQNIKGPMGELTIKIKAEDEPSLETALQDLKTKGYEAVSRK